MAKKITATRKPAAAKKTAPARRTVADDVRDEAKGAGASRVARARARRGPEPIEAPTPATVELAEAPTAQEVAATAPAAKPERKSPPAPAGTIKTLLRGSSAKALGFDQAQPDWLPAAVVSRQGTPQESWRYNLEPATLARLVLFLEASGQNGPVSKDAKYLRTLVPAGLLPAPAPASPEPAASAV